MRQTWLSPPARWNDIPNISILECGPFLLLEIVVARLEACARPRSGAVALHSVCKPLRVYKTVKLRFEDCIHILRDRLRYARAPDSPSSMFSDIHRTSSASWYTRMYHAHCKPTVEARDAVSAGTGAFLRLLSTVPDLRVERTSCAGLSQPPVIFSGKQCSKTTFKTLHCSMTNRSLNSGHPVSCAAASCSHSAFEHPNSR